MPPTDNLDDVVVRAQGGDQAAFQSIVTELLDEVRIFVAAHARSFDLVDEVVQATFVACYQSLGTYRPHGTFVPWLKSIARHKLLQELQRRAKYCAIEGDALEAVLARGSCDALESSQDDGEWLKRMRTCLESLPGRSREMLTRHHAQDIPLNRLAQQFKQSELAVASTLKRLRRAVRNCMQARGAVR